MFSKIFGCWPLSIVVFDEWPLLDFRGGPEYEQNHRQLVGGVRI
jgi:hypothetical protein